MCSVDAKTKTNINTPAQWPNLGDLALLLPTKAIQDFLKLFVLCGAQPAQLNLDEIRDPTAGSDPLFRPSDGVARCPHLAWCT